MSFDTLLITLDLIGTFVFALSGAAEGAKHRLDLFGVLVLSFAAGTAGGLVRDVLIGSIPPAGISDYRPRIDGTDQADAPGELIFGRFRSGGVNAGLHLHVQTTQVSGHLRVVLLYDLHPGKHLFLAGCHAVGDGAGRLRVDTFRVGSPHAQQAGEQQA